MSLINAQVELAEAILNEQETDLVSPNVNLIIYRNNVLTTLNELLMTVYPMVVKLVGADFFRTIAAQYIAQYPSRQSDLHQYGEYFSDFLSQADWIEQYFYLIDLAKFEWLCHTLQFVAEPEIANLAHLNELQVADYAALHFVLNPTCHILQSSAPIFAIIDLCEGVKDGLLQIDYTEEHYFILMKRENEIKIHKLTNADYVFLMALGEGQPLMQALKATLSLEADFDLPTKLMNWVKQGVIIESYLVELNPHAEF